MYLKILVEKRMFVQKTSLFKKNQGRILDFTAEDCAFFGIQIVFSFHVYAIFDFTFLNCYGDFFLYCSTAILSSDPFLFFFIFFYFRQFASSIAFCCSEFL